MAGSSTPNSKLARQPMEYNRKIFNILQVTPKISQELQQILNSAAEAFNIKSYKLASKHFKSALDSMILNDRKTAKDTLILTKYMLCSCLLESKDAKDLSDGLKILEELEKSHGFTYPMLYYAVGRAYFKLYRFNKADEILKKGFAVLNGDVKIVEYCIPGTKIVIPESSKERLVAALVKLNDQCSGWHRPDAVCCMSDCSTIGHNEGADKNIFVGNPTFNGMVQVICNNPSNFCTMSFHLACWKAKKEQMCTLGKISDKEVLHTECFTPNCENQGVRCTIKKIEIFDENAQVKATIEPRPDDQVWHAKPTPSPKGAIRKQQQQQQQQQQQPKLKVGPNESRPPVEKHLRPSFVPNEPTKVDETEEEDDQHDEMALITAMENLNELRANNFYIRDDMIWRPDLSMYGNEYMLATAEALPDPDFSNDDTQEQEKKAFILSYFYTFLSNNGPIKLDVLEEKWNEAKNIIEHCDSILNHHLDIKEFLLQSLKFAVVGNYICTADKLPDAYHLAKTDACEIVKFFMEHDIDQQSSSSSIDDEALFNNIINQEKNNNSLPYSTIPEDDKSVIAECTIASNFTMDAPSNNDENHTDEPENSKIVEQEMETFEIPTKVSTDVPEISTVVTTPSREIVDAEKPVISKTCVLSNDEIAEAEKPVISKTSILSNDEIAEVEKPVISKTSILFNDEIAEAEKLVISKTSILFNDEIAEADKLVISKTSILSNDEIAEAEKRVIAKACELASRKYATPKRKFVQKRSHSPDSTRNDDQSRSMDESVIKVQKECVEKINIFIDEDSPKATINGTHNVQEIEKELRKAASEMSIVPDKLVKETKSTGDLETDVDSIENIDAPLIIHSGEPDEGSISKKENIRTPLIIHFGEPDKGPMSTKENIPRGSQEDEKKKRDMEELETRASNIAKSDELQQEMREKLMKKEIEELRSEFAQAKRVNEAMRKHMLQKILHGQYLYNDAVIAVKLEKAKNNYDIISGIQGILASSIGQMLPINGSEWLKIIGELNKISGNNRDKFVRLEDQLSASEEVEKLQEMELPPVELPNLPKCDLIDIIQSAFGMYRMHQMKEFQKLQLVPMPQPQVQPLFRAPLSYGQTIDYHQSYMFQNNPAYNPSQSAQPFMHPPSSFMHAMTAQKTVDLPLQQQQQQQQQQQKVGAPLISNNSLPPLMSSIYGSLKISNSPKYESIILENRKFSPQQNPHASVKPPGSYHANTPSADALIKAKYPVAKPEETAMEQTFPIFDPRDGKYSEKPKIFPSPQQQQQQQQQKLSASVLEQPKIIPAQQRNTPDTSQKNSSNLDELKDVSSKFHISQESNGQASGIRSVSSKEKNIQDHSSKWQDKLLPSSNAQSEINMHIVESPLNYDTYANPETTQKDDEMMSNETIHENFTEAASLQGETKLQKKAGHSMDKLMRRLRSQYPGVLEMDLLKGVECVRKKHNNSLSRIPMLRIIREADKFIGARQQKQLCGYEKRYQNQIFTVQHLNAWNHESERKRQGSVSSTSSMNSGKQSSLTSKKQWEPVTIPNDGWVKETQESECAICFDTMPTSAGSYTLQCKHTFHKKCIKNWFQHNQSCPTCRVHSTIDDEYPPLPLG